jgi:hypothetical protein
MKNITISYSTWVAFQLEPSFCQSVYIDWHPDYLHSNVVHSPPSTYITINTAMSMSGKVLPGQKNTNVTFLPSP